MFIRLTIFAIFGVVSSLAFTAVGSSVAQTQPKQEKQEEQKTLEHWLEQFESTKNDERIEAALKVGELLPSADEVDADKGYQRLFLALGDRASLVQSAARMQLTKLGGEALPCLLYTSPSPRDATLSRMPSSA